MNTSRDLDRVKIDMSTAEARAFLEELLGVRGGSRLPKLKQVCAELSNALAMRVVRAPSSSRTSAADWLKRLAKDGRSMGKKQAAVGVDSDQEERSSK